MLNFRLKSSDPLLHVFDFMRLKTHLVLQIVYLLQTFVVFISLLARLHCNRHPKEQNDGHQ